jgi:hypothetical protein
MNELGFVFASPLLSCNIFKGSGVVAMRTQRWWQCVFVYLFVDVMWSFYGGLWVQL